RRRRRWGRRRRTASPAACRSSPRRGRPTASAAGCGTNGRSRNFLGDSGGRPTVPIISRRSMCLGRVIRQAGRDGGLRGPARRRGRRGRRHSPGGAGGYNPPCFSLWPPGAPPIPEWLSQVVTVSPELSPLQRYGLAFLLGSFAVATLSDLRRLSAQREFLEV